jgi:SAM-dependent methyltransferase
MDNFANRLTAILNHGALNLALAIGYKHRIFDTLEDLSAPVTVDQLASATGLNSRYVKEWLGIMTTGDILVLTQNAEGENTYYLPPAHARYLTRNAGSDNLGVYTQEIPLLTACAMNAVHKGMHTGDGIPFSAYPEFQAFMAELSDAKHEKMLISEFLPSVDEGRLVVRLGQGIRVCDLGCGCGVAANLMAQAFPNCTITGIDNHPEAIATAREAARQMGLSNVAYCEEDAATLYGKPDWSNRFDYICAFDAIHDQSHPLQALRGVRHMLASGGWFSMIDIKAGSDHADNLDHPMGPFLYTVSLMHCMPVGLNDDGRGLGMMWGREAAEALLREAGFNQINIVDMAYDPFNLHYLCKAA